MRLKVIGFLIGFTSFLYAQNMNYVLNTGGLVDERVFEKVNSIGAEVKLKTGANVYLDVKGDNGINPETPLKERIELMKQHEQEMVKNLVKPYVILAIAMDQKYANVMMSDDLKNVVNKDDVLDGYVIPLLAAKDKNLLKSKVSAASLNGYAEIADSIARYKGIELVSSIGSQGKVASTLWKVFMYTLVLIGIILYAVIVMREKKIKRELTERDAKEAREKEKNGNE